MTKLALRPPLRLHQPGNFLWRTLVMIMIGLALSWGDVSWGGTNNVSSRPNKAAVKGMKTPESIRAAKKKQRELRRQKARARRARRRARKLEVALLPPPVLVKPAPGGRSKAKVEKGDSSESKTGWSGSLSGAHYGGFYEDVDPTSMLAASAAFKFSFGMSMNVGQSVTKLYRVLPGESEWKASDTSLGLSGQFTKDWFAGVGVSGSVGATLPVSEVSKRVNNLTKLSGSVKFSRSFLDKKISLSLSPKARYHVNRYTTTPTYEGSGGGRPLTRYSIGGALGLGFNFHEKLSLSSSASVQQVFYEKVQYENTTSTLGVTNPPTHFYSWGASLNFSPFENWSLSAGYNHGQKLENPWGVEVLVFDDRVSQWTLGTSVSF